MRQEQTVKISLPKEKRLAQAFDEIAAIGYFDFFKDKPRYAFGTVRDQFSIVNRIDWSLTCDMENFVRTNSFTDVEGIFEKQSDMFASMENYGVDAALMGVDKMLENTFMRRYNGLSPAFQIKARYKQLSQTPMARLMICGEDPLEAFSDLKNMRIATSYPNILRQWLESKNVMNADIIYKDSSVEDMIRRDEADYVCDVVETGDTLKDYGYQAFLKVARVYPVLAEPINQRVKSNMGYFRERLKLAEKPNAPIPEAPSVSVA